MTTASVNNQPSARHGWVRLLRPPNLLTVPGDPIAGALLVGASNTTPTPPLSAIATGAGVSLLLYCAGLLSNDWFDYAEDARDRPKRPLPSGQVSRTAAACAAITCAALALAFAATRGLTTLATAGCVAALILAYNGATKHLGNHLGWLGAVNMGACRGGSLLLGAAAAGWQPAFNAPSVGALAVTTYITAVTLLAMHETRTTPMPVRRWLPVVVVAVFCPVMLHSATSAQRLAPSLLASAAMAWTILLARRLGSAPPPPVLIPSIGAYIRGLLLLQAFLASLASPPAGWIAAAVILVAWPLNATLGRRFYAS